MIKNKKAQGMVDITGKDVTKRVAKAEATITLGKKAYTELMEGGSPKGDVFEIARVAAVMAAKNTPNIIPLCHPLSLSKAALTYVTDDKKCSVTLQSEIVCTGKTGVEMEALTAVSAAALTIYDMMKWADKSMVISNIRLLAKSGGKSGDYRAAN